MSVAPTGRRSAVNRALLWTTATLLAVGVARLGLSVLPNEPTPPEATTSSRSPASPVGVAGPEPSSIHWVRVPGPEAVEVALRDGVWVGSWPGAPPLDQRATARLAARLRAAPRAPAGSAGVEVGDGATVWSVRPQAADGASVEALSRDDLVDRVLIRAPADAPLEIRGAAGVFIRSDGRWTGAGATDEELDAAGAALVALRAVSVFPRVRPPLETGPRLRLRVAGRDYQLVFGATNDGLVRVDVNEHGALIRAAVAAPLLALADPS